MVQGRDDDNIETIRKRFRVFVESSLPVVEYYDMKGKVRKVSTSSPSKNLSMLDFTMFSSFYNKSSELFDFLLKVPTSLILVVAL